jgi:hypothetical protein
MKETAPKRYFTRLTGALGLWRADRPLMSDATPGIIDGAFLAKELLRMSWRNARRRMWRLLASSIAALGLALVVLTPTAANAATAQVDKPDAALTASWWQQVVAISGASSLDRCDLGTEQIMFLAGTTGGSATRSCTTNKTVFLVPLINVECSTAEGNGTTFAELSTCAKGFADDFSHLKLRVDGQAIGNLQSLRVQAQSTFTSVKGNVFGIPKAKNTQFAADGYWALITLTPGTHTLTFGGSYPPGGFTTEVTYNLLITN